MDALYYANRLKELNNQAEDKDVLSSIDRPIRPLVVELNRIGLKTMFSCCGFPYEGEEEPKSHSKFPFIVLLHPLENLVDRGRAVSAFFYLGKIVESYGWTLYPYCSIRWYLSGERIVKGDDSFYRKEAEEKSIHDYERSLISIKDLTNQLKAIPSIEDKIEIVDGNSIAYPKVLGGEWQVKPKNTSVISLTQEVG